MPRLNDGSHGHAPNRCTRIIRDVTNAFAARNGTHSAKIAEQERSAEDLKAKSGPSLLQEKLGQRNASDIPISS